MEKQAEHGTVASKKGRGIDQRNSERIERRRREEQRKQWERAFQQWARGVLE